MQYTNRKEYLYHIYMIECNIDLRTGKQLEEFIPVYIGSTHRTLKERFSEHKYSKIKIDYYIRKYGIDHFQIRELLTIFSTRNVAHKVEELITINYLKSFDLVNVSYGDMHSEEYKQKIHI